MNDTKIIKEMTDLLENVPRDILNLLLKDCYILDFDTKKYCHKYLYNSVSDCKENKYKNSNPEFPQFRQTIFHAGSKDQFKQFAKLSENKNKIKILKTFDYLFDNFKKPSNISSGN